MVFKLRLRGYGSLSTELSTECSHSSIEAEHSLYVWKTGEGFLGWFNEDIKTIVVASGVMFQINERQVGQVSVYCDKDGCCVCSMAFQCGSMMVKLTLLQAGTVALGPKKWTAISKPFSMIESYR